MFHNVSMSWSSTLFCLDPFIGLTWCLWKNPLGDALKSFSVCPSFTMTCSWNWHSITKSRFFLFSGFSQFFDLYTSSFFRPESNFTFGLWLFVDNHHPFQCPTHGMVLTSLRYCPMNSRLAKTIRFRLLVDIQRFQKRKHHSVWPFSQPQPPH